MRKYSKIGLENRKKERAGYSDFFAKHIKNIKDNKIKCEECGKRLKGNHSEVCHILPKNFFKSIALEDENILYLCGMYSDNGCHDKFDNSKMQVIREMKVFKKAKEHFEKLEESITERISYKIYDKFK